MEIKLIKPTLEYANDIMEYKKEFLQCGDTMAGCGNLREYSTAEEWIDDNELRERNKTVPSDKVTSNAYIAVRISDNKIVGMINFRHHINHPILSTWGGHIGYSVRPCERKKGYATEMLKQVIINCEIYGLDKILVTCDKDNIGSKKTIIANGGLFEKDIEVDGDTIERYWIQLQQGNKVSELILVKSSKDLEEKILEYKQEYLDFEETNINGSCGLAHYNYLDEWLEIVLSIEKDKLRNNVNASTFFSVRKSDNKIIGTIQLRHFLTDELEKHGGHIGYGIRPTERKKGYGKQQLLLVLEIAKDMKIPKVMITCDKDNIASSHAAMSCGGILTGENLHEGKEQQIYWINLRQ